VSVVIPVLDCDPFLSEQLMALTRQTFDGPWEVVVVDNGCTDRSMDVARAFADRLPALRIVRAPVMRNLNHARNVGAAAARGDFLAFCDGDDVVSAGWLAALVEAGREAHVVGGAIENLALNGERVRDWRREEGLFEVPVKFGFLPAVPGGNCAMWAQVARALRWDEDFAFAGSDIEFSWRAAIHSYRIAFAPDAVIQQRHRRDLIGMVRQHYAYGRAGPHLFRRFRRSGMPRSDARTAAREWRLLVRAAPGLLRSADERGHWARTLAYRAGALGGSLRFRVLFP
jgi:glycosyltransferase involved in cell wall biosynthesis